MPVSARLKQQKRNNTSIESILSYMRDADYVRNRMPHAVDGEEFVATKFSEAVYGVRAGFDLISLTKEFIKHAKESLPIEGAKFAYVFAIPYTSTISLPNGYLASRVDPENQTAVSLEIYNGIARVTAGTESVPIGVTYLLAGHFVSKPSDARNAFSHSLSYTNDVLIALKATRHDHHLTVLTPKTLPSHLDYYEIDLSEPVTGNPKTLTLSAHDLMDLWAKRLPDTKEHYQEFVGICENLVFKPEIRYLLDLMSDCVTHFCLGRYERVILDSDRFAELSFRLCFTRNDALREHDVKKIKRLYHPDPTEETILSLLMLALALPKTDLIRQWAGKARKIRNSMAHDLDFSVANEKAAMQALKYNMNVVDYIAGAHGPEDWDILLLRKGAALVHHLFEEPPRTKSQSVRRPKR